MFAFQIQSTLTPLKYPFFLAEDPEINLIALGLG